MASIFLRLLLVIALTFNGSASAWASLIGGHGDAASTAEHAHHHHGHGHDADQARGSHDHGGRTDHHHGGGCCDGTTCQCGCVLPPALPLAIVVTVLASPMPAPLSPVLRHVAAAPSSRLLRPPIG